MVFKNTTICKSNKSFFVYQGMESTNTAQVGCFLNPNVTKPFAYFTASPTKALQNLEHCSGLQDNMSKMKKIECLRSRIIVQSECYCNYEISDSHESPAN